MAKNVAEVYKESSEKYGTLPAFFSKDDKKKYIPTNFKELYESGLNLAEALIDLGVNAREKIGMIADHRLEWVIADAATLFTGSADVPRGTDVTEPELEYILEHSEAKVLFVENDKVLEKFNRIKSKTSVKTVIMMDPKAKGEKGVLNLYELIERGKQLRGAGSKKAEARIADIKPDDLLTLIYTSGTTGKPKGVMLMHSNLMHQIDDVTPLLQSNSKDRFLSILPVWHIFERAFMYVAIFSGSATYFTNVRDMRDDFGKAKPTFMGSAPRLWESIYLGIYNRVKDPKQTPAIRRALFNTAYFFSKHYHAAIRFLKGNEIDLVGRNPIISFFLGLKSLVVAILTFLPYLLLDAVVLSKIRLATGGKLRATCSGGGALPSHVDAFFNDIGIRVLEGYGMTETSPVISVRTFKKLVMGSVGKVAPKSEVQIRDFNGDVLTHVKMDGKIEGKRCARGIVYVRGPQVMKGYYKNPEATDKALKDGWMDTGDLGMINYKDTLTLTGRAKDTVVLLGGENVEPVPIENKLLESPYISQIMVIGQDQKNLGAIVIPEFPKLKEWALANGVTETDESALISNTKVVDFYKKEIKDLNSAKHGFKSFEQVSPFFLVSKPFEVGDELTNLMKLKRHIITDKYKDQIKKIYS
ncbi:long-chain fatty acid--CoA ligase [Leptospira ognonensis]|uniref:Long-chain fatty acid--CoA ligase n=1 Tax=Leptospira ognonensis TaxID=2484945 RepID=A0A4R9JU24_9LEPT|nr:AMP-binding protein [Leptospira ognonensis]TGL56293.1 long-chain fatty acid--CoA ligase [Leptospira ognonensis]